MIQENSIDLCANCSGPLSEYVCRGCNIVHCPFCGRSENELCEHLVADWAGIGGNSNKFHYRFPFPDGVLPFIEEEPDFPSKTLPINANTALGRLSPLLKAYWSIFAPPNPIVLFNEIVEFIGGPGEYAERSEPGMAGMGGHVFWFSPDPQAARANIASTLFELLESMEELHKRLKFQAVEKRGSRPVHHEEELVYGEISESLVFIKRRRACQLESCHQTLRKADTSGQFRLMVPPDDYSRIIDFMQHAVDFDEFFEKSLEKDPHKEPEQARIEYLQLPVGKRYPEDEDPFIPDEATLPEYGSWPEWPAQEMLKWVPRKIQERYGSVQGTLLNGEYLEFSCQDERNIIAAFSRHGYDCVRDDDLVQRACGYEV